MIQLLADRWIKKAPHREREIYGIVCSVMGIVLNVILCGGKFLAGTLSGSIAIVADAVNNLSDAASSVVTLAGFKLAEQKADEEHPFGHGRMEYVSGLAVAAVILLMAYELIRDSVVKIMHPEETDFTYVTLCILIVSIAVKAYMAFYNGRIGRRIRSSAMKAAAADSLGDVAATTVVLASSLAGHFTGLKLDGYCGVAVGLFVLYAGVTAAKETVSPLLGEKPDEEYVRNITDIVLSHEAVCGMHDLVVHDYGPGRRMISLHAEVSDQEDIRVIHDVIDHIENELRRKLGCEATIHMDPIVTADEKVQRLRLEVESLLSKWEEIHTMHDFRIVEGPTHTNLIFDVVVSFSSHIREEELVKDIQGQIRISMGNQYYAVVHVDRG